jgi:protocatechuate 3,4-dioxygenase beta subunit
MSDIQNFSSALPKELTYTVVPDKGSDPNASYVDITFTNNGADNIFEGLTIDGYCLDAKAPIAGNTEYTAQVYSSYEQLPDSLKYPNPDNPTATEGVIFNPDSLNIINWIVNQNFEGRASVAGGTFTSGDVQKAIWSFIDDDNSAGQLGPFDQARIDEITSLATAEGAGFVPSYNYTNYYGEEVTGKMAVILAPNDDDGDGLADAQIVIAEVELSKLGDKVWEDTDADGIQDAGEDGISGVTVNLLADIDGDGEIEAGEIIDTTTTDADGNYDFEVIAGDYQVEFEQPDGYEVSPANQGGDDTVDSDGLISDVVTLNPGEEDPTIDAGFYQPASLGDKVFEDTDGDGIQDAGEDGISGVTVTLTGAGEDGQFDTADDITESTTTDANGEYSFTELTPGDYKVTFDRPEGYEFTDANQGDDDAADSDVDPITGMTQVVTLSPGEDNTTVDAGLVQLASLGDTVFHDKNADGIQDAGEEGIAGATVTLTDADGNTTETTTDANGNYSFDGLNPGDYTVDFTTPDGYTESSPANVGNDDAVDSDGTSVSTNLESGEDDTTLDSGFYNLASLGDKVFFDTNADGIQDAGEAGVDGVTVNLLQDGEVVGTQVTANGGEYLFTDLVPGDYQVEFVAPDGFEFTTANLGGNDVDSDADPTTGLTQTVTLESGDNNLTLDAGLVQQVASLGDTVFHDKNADGIQDEGEEGIAGATVTLTDADGNTTETTTDANGNYNFDGLTPGDYTVDFTTPEGYTESSPANVGNDDAVDSDGTSVSTTLEADENDLTLDSGFYNLASLGDKVFLDSNADGIQDAGEAGVDGVTVNLIQGGQVVGTQVTANGGEYLFTDLVPGDYQVEFVAPDGFEFTTANQGGDDAVDSDANPTTGLTQTVTLESGENNLTLDAGLLELTPGIEIEKLVNGEDADTAAEAVEIAAGDDAIFTYEVTNTGEVSFAADEVVVTDDNGTAGDTSDDFNPDQVLDNGFNVGDANQNNALDTGETWSYTKTLAAEDLSTSTTTTTNHVIDFEGFDKGTVIDNEYASLGVTISASGGSNQAMIFDSANPTGGDGDLKTPGYGANNTTAQGNILIISEDGDSSDPDDNARGGTIAFDFDNGVNINSLSFVDIEENGGKVFTTDANGNVTTTDIPGVGDNSFQTLTINDDDVVKLEVQLKGSGSISSLDFDKLEIETAPGLYTNIGTVTAGDASDTDAANYVNPEPVIENPGIEIEKFVNGEDVTDINDLPEIEAGSDVTFTYEVSNTGNVAFAKDDVKVIDDNGTASDTSDDFEATYVSGDANSNNLLDTDETWTYTSATEAAQDLTVTTTSEDLRFHLTGSSYTTGAYGNVRTFNEGGVSVDVSAFRSDKHGNGWQTAYLGAYGGGLGVTNQHEEWFRSPG